MQQAPDEFEAQARSLLAIKLYKIGRLSTALALLLRVVAQQRTPPHQAALLLTLEPVFAALTASLFLGERLSGRGLVGCGLILIAMLVAGVSRR